MDELVIGTYEGFLLGYSLRSEDNVSIHKIMPMIVCGVTTVDYISGTNFYLPFF